MLAIRGVYNSGKIELNENLELLGKFPVIVTFLEEFKREEPKKLDFDSFSFKQAREILKDYHGSLSDAVIEER